MITQEAADALVAELAQSPERGAPFRRRSMEALSRIPGYDWSGVYRMEDGELALDEFVGATTDHTRIPIGLGVCGTAVKENRNQIVEDVRQLDNYLACSVETRSEIVVLIRADDQVLGQIDIDGHEVGTFDSSDERMLTRVADLIADRWS